MAKFAFIIAFISCYTSCTFGYAFSPSSSTEDKYICRVPDKKPYVFTHGGSRVLEPGFNLDAGTSVSVFCKNAGFVGSLSDNELKCDKKWEKNINKLDLCDPKKCLLPSIWGSNITKQLVISAGKRAGVLCNNQFDGTTYEISVTCKSGGVIEDLAGVNCQRHMYAPCEVPKGEHFQFNHHGRLSSTIPRQDYFSLVCDSGYHLTKTISSVYCTRRGVQAIVESTTQTDDGPLFHSVHTKLPKNICAPK